jgi:hypothetical protein
MLGKQPVNGTLQISLDGKRSVLVDKEDGKTHDLFDSLKLNMLLVKILFPGGTSRKNGFYSPQLVPKLFDQQLKGALVPVHSKMWAREH